MEKTNVGGNQPLEEMRRNMLFRRNSEVKMSAENARLALFEGRSVVLHPEQLSNPASAETSADPHRLFQLLKKKKRVPHNIGSASALQLNMNLVRPAPTEGTNSARPMNSARPFSPVDRPSTIFSRTVHSANSSTNGRPATRQKHPKQSLDLFPSRVLKEENPFPLPAQTRRNSKEQAVQAPLRQVVKQPPQNNNVNFNCLFFNSDDELDANEEFPAPKAQAHIPLIETDWFTSDAWVQLPTGDGAAQVVDDELGPEDGSDSQYAESLYELLVAQKKAKPSRPHA